MMIDLVRTEMMIAHNMTALGQPERHLEKLKGRYER